MCRSKRDHDFANRKIASSRMRKITTKTNSKIQKLISFLEDSQIKMGKKLFTSVSNA